MTIKEKLETIKGKKIAIQCTDEWQAIIIYKHLNYNGTYWNNNGVSTCYDYANNKYLMHCYLEWYKSNGYKIILFRNFFDGFDFSGEIDDINAILDEKYGKDNWVIK